MKKLAGMVVLAILLICLKAPSAFPQEIVPFETANQSPLISIYGLPAPGNYLLPPAGKTEMGLNFILTSNASDDSNARESVSLDGETRRFTLAVRHTVFPRLQVGLKIPYVQQTGGSLDGFIENFHGAFGFPQGNRDETPRNQLLYLYRRDGVDRLRVDSSTGGIGDLALATSLQLYEEKESRQGLTVNFGLKLPTGNSDQLLGSGSTDLAVWLTGGAEEPFAIGKWAAFASAGMLFMTEGDVLPEQQKKWAAFGSLGLGWAPLPWLSLKVQLDAHTPLYENSDLKQVAGNAVQLVMGGSLSFTESTMLDIGVIEDPAGAAVPDVSLYLNLRTRF